MRALFVFPKALIPGNQEYRVVTRKVQFAKHGPALLVPALLILISSPAFCQKVLVIGDSHLNGALGEQVYKRLSKNFGKDQIGMASSCGSWALHWITGHRTKCGYTPRGFVKGKREKVRSTPKLANLLKEHDPDSVVVMLGTNFIGHSEKAAQYYINKMLKQLNDSRERRCTWIGPPKTCFDSVGSGMTRTRVDKYIKELVEKQCKYVSITDLTEYPTYPDCPFMRRKRKKGEPDGKHYDWTGEEFADAIDRWANAAVLAVTGRERKQTSYEDAVKPPSARLTK